MGKPFEGIFGNNCELRLMEFFLPLKGMEFSITEIAEEAEVSRPTATKVVKKFVENGILKISQKRGGSNLYEINPSSPFVTLFENLNNIIIEQMLDEDTLHAIHEMHLANIPRRPVDQRQMKPDIFSQRIGESPIINWGTPSNIKDEFSKLPQIDSGIPCFGGNLNDAR